jgi:hypothetical protein
MAAAERIMNQSISYEIAAVTQQVLASGVPTSLCTLQEPDRILIDAGQPSGNYSDIAGLIDLVVISAPVSSSAIHSDEKRSIDEVQAFAPRYVTILGYYPQITGGVLLGWRAVIDGTPFDLLGAEPDSQRQTTRLSVRLTGL